MKATQLFPFFLTLIALNSHLLLPTAVAQWEGLVFERNDTSFVDTRIEIINGDSFAELIDGIHGGNYPRGQFEIRAEFESRLSQLIQHHRELTVLDSLVIPVRIVTSIDYKPDNEVVEIRFSRDLIPDKMSQIVRENKFVSVGILSHQSQITNRYNGIDFKRYSLLLPRSPNKLYSSYGLPLTADIEFSELSSIASDRLLLDGIDLPFPMDLAKRRFDDIEVMLLLVPSLIESHLDGLRYDPRYFGYWDYERLTDVTTRSRLWTSVSVSAVIVYGGATGEVYFKAMVEK